MRGRTGTARRASESSLFPRAPLAARRQWAVEKFGLWEGELEFTVGAALCPSPRALSDARAADLLEADVRNNSAWNHRWFVIERTEKVRGVAWLTCAELTRSTPCSAVH